MYSILAEGTGAEGVPGGGIMTIIWIVIMVVMLIFMFNQPRKEQKKKEAMLKELAVGDTVLTTSGFYGTVIDIADDTVIVEFGNNRNCRIPMQRAAISMIEKPEAAQ